MRKFTYAVLAGLMLLSALDADAQIGRSASKDFQRRQSKKISQYNGPGGFPRESQYWTIGAGVGYANYFGDLAPDRSAFSTVYDQATPYFGVFAMRRMTPHLSLKGEVGYMRIAADDASLNPSQSLDHQSRYMRNLSFQNNIFEGSLVLQGDILPTPRGPGKRPPFNAHGFVGLSVFTNNPQALGPKGTDLADTWVDLRPLKTEGQATAYSTVNLGIPLGIGASYRLSDNLDVSLEMGYRITFTNYLDDVGSKYPSLSALQSMTPTARSFANRSAERFTAAGGVDRFTKELPFNNRSWDRDVRTVSVYDNQPAVDANGQLLTGVDGQPLRAVHFNGTVGTQEPRGGSGRDYMFITAVKIHYIIPEAKRGTRARF